MKTQDEVGRKLVSGEEGFIEIQVDPIEFNLDKDGIASKPVSITFYYLDTFQGPINISIFNQNNTFSSLLKLNGTNSGEIRKSTIIYPQIFISNVWNRVHYGEEIISGSIICKIKNN